MASEITVGIDIGTSSVKAIAADADGNVVASSRIPHEIQIPAADRFQHDAARRVARRPAHRARRAASWTRRRSGVSVSAMVPSLTAVDARRRSPDSRPALRRRAGPVRARVAPTRWRAGSCSSSCAGPGRGPGRDRRSGPRRLSRTTRCAVKRSSTRPPRPPRSRSSTGRAGIPEVAASLGITVEQLPRLVPTAWECGRVGGADGPVLASGCIDALADQIVAGADNDGDVLVLLGTTLIVNTVTPSHDPVPGYWVIPHTTRGKFLAGGPSNAGGLFVNWATAPLADVGRCDARTRSACRCGRRTHAASGCRCTTPTAAACCADLDLTHGAAALRRAAFEASRVRRPPDDRRRPRRARHRPAPDHRDRGRNPGRRVGAGARGLHRPPGRAHAGAGRRRARLGVPGPLRGRPRGRAGCSTPPAGPAPGAPSSRHPAWVGPADERYLRFLDLSA